jgi:hypothetical protein
MNPQRLCIICAQVRLWRHQASTTSMRAGKAIADRALAFLRR